MIPPPTHIQEALDCEFPGVRLEWNADLGYWMLTDYYFPIDGELHHAYNGYSLTPPVLRGIEPYPYTLRRLIWVVGDLETGERWPLYHDRIMDTLRRAYRGVHPDQVNEWLDSIEASEERAEQASKKEERARARESADTVWSGLKRSTFGKGIRRTPWTFSKALDKHYAAKQREEHGEAEAEVDKIVAEQAARGQVTMVSQSVIHGPTR